MPQSWKIPVSPSMRVLLFGLLSPRVAEIADAAQGRVFRRTWNALGLRPIDEALLNNSQRINTKLSQSHKLALHTISIEMADYLFDKLVNRPRFPGDVLQLGDLFDALDCIRDKKEGWEGLSNEGLGDYAPMLEDWTPTPLNPRGELIVAMAAMADATPDQRAIIWRNISQKVGGAEGMCLAAESLVEEIRAIVTAQTLTPAIS